MALRARRAVTVVFALNGALFASLFGRLPAIQERAGLGDGTLGLALLCSMLWLVASQLVAGALVSRVGSRPVIQVGAVGYGLGLVPAASARSFAELAAALAWIGFANGLLDVAMNTHGLTVERALRRPILSTLHAAFSFGGLAGAGLAALLASADVGVVSHLGVVAAAGVVTALSAARLLLPRTADATPQGPMVARPERALVAVGVFAFCVLLAEGAVNDWSAIFLDDDIATSEGLAAIGLAGFSLMMGIGRLAGDRLDRALGPVVLARAGAALALAGITVVLSAGAAAVAVAGFATIGLGLAALFPLGVRAAAARGDAPGPSVAAVSAFGYLGLLTGPPAVGGLSALFGLRPALGLVAAMIGVAMLAAGALRAPAGSGV